MKRLFKAWWIRSCDVEDGTEAMGTGDDSRQSDRRLGNPRLIRGFSISHALQSLQIALAEAPFLSHLGTFLWTPTRIDRILLSNIDSLSDN